MRGLLIFVWCVVTAMMFYSSWRFKAPEIEADITARVSENVSQAGGQNVAVEVDGRHVNLRGFAASQPQKSQFLETADETYGALGPIDGLMLPAAPTRTFLSAANNDGKLTLAGVVGSEEEREMLLKQASAAGFGEVQDDLTISNGKVAWSDNALVGFSKLADLSSGHLYVSDDRSALSGSAPTTEIAASAAGLGEGWNSFVAGPQQADPRIGELEAIVGERDTTIADLSVEIDGKNAEIAELQSKVEGVEASATELESDLSAAKLQLTALQDEREADQARIDELKNDVSETQALVASVTETSDSRILKIAELQKQLDEKELSTNNLQSEMATMASSLALLRDGSNSTTETLSAELDAKSSELAEMEAAMAEMSASKDGEIASLNGQISSLSDEKSALDAELASLRDGTESDLATLQTRNADLEGENTTLKSQAEELRAQATALENKSAEDVARIASLEEELASKSGELTTLNQNRENNNAQQTARISALEAQNENIKGELAKVTSELAERNATIDEMNGRFDQLSNELGSAQSGLAETEELKVAALARGSELESQLAERNTRLDNVSVENNELKVEIDLLKNQVTELEATQSAEVARLRGTVGERDTKIAELMRDLEALPEGTPSQAFAICDETASQLLETQKINFETNSSEILDESVPILERITGVTLACFGSKSDARLTISGHTDSRGDSDENQELSVDRARSVATFLANRGVDATMLIADGFGEDQPIADNETEEGRTANRRISLKFSAR